MQEIADARRRGEAVLPGRGRIAARPPSRRAWRRRRRSPRCRPGSACPRRAGAPDRTDAAALRAAEIDAARAARRGEPADARERALQRGMLVHRLLQSLPEIAAGATPRRRAGYLARNADGLDRGRSHRAGRPRAGADRGSPLRAGVRRRQPRRGARSSAGCSSRAACRLLVSGQIDRLVVTRRRGADRRFQDQPRPRRVDESEVPVSLSPAARAVPRGARAALSPAKPVRAALLWTEAPEMMEISSAALDAGAGTHHVGVSVLDPARPRS